MSEQGNAVNPGQAIYDALSDEAKAAVDALPDDVFVGEAGLMAARRLTESIRMANSIKAGGWLLSPDSPTNGRVRLALIVSGTRLIHVQNRQELVVRYDNNLLDASTRDWLMSSGFQTEAVLKTWPNLHRVYIPFQRLPEVPSGLWVSHEAAARLQNEPDWKYEKASIKGDWHKDSWRIKLGLLTGEDVPAPSYMPTDRLGLNLHGDSGPLSVPDGYDYMDVPEHGTKAMPASFEPPGGTGSPGLAALTRAFASAGLTYTHAQIASFYTALQAKGFVILSGISGTGKSKIAQRFSSMLPNAIVDAQRTSEDSSYGIRLRLRPYMQKYSRFAIPMKYQEQLPLPAPGESWDVAIEIEGMLGECRVHTSDGSHSNNSWICFIGAAVDHFRAIDGEYFRVEFYADDEQKLDKIDLRIDKLRSNPPVREDDVVSFVRTLEPSMRQYHSFVIPKSEADRIRVPKIGSSHVVPGAVGGVHGDLRIENVRNNLTGESRVIRIGLRGTMAEEFAALQGQTFAVRMELNSDRSVNRVVIVPPEELGEEASRSTYAQRSNHLFLPVRPDWRDGKPLIGYHNPLSGEYVRTPFLDFVLAAADDYRAGNRNAFFVILDEMNLAHVEYYFADVLSVIESGRDAEGWTVEGIPLAVGEEDADLPETLRLPPNLYIVGTVNMDETTHPFSPKVLDRAFTIELTEVSFEDYPPEPLDSADLTDEDRQALLAAFTRQGRYPRIDKDEIREVVETHPRYRADLQRLNTSLRRHRMHFGYRVFDEVMQFVLLAEENGLFADPDDAFDRAVLMKVLPKFNGSRGKLQHALFELLHWCRTPMAIDTEHRAAYESQFTQLLEDGKSFADVVIADAGTVEDNWRYPATGRRTALMMQDLYTDGFASFG